VRHNCGEFGKAAATVKVASILAAARRSTIASLAGPSVRSEVADVRACLVEGNDLRGLKKGLAFSAFGCCGWCAGAGDHVAQLVAVGYP
jgi:hypothetical protein